ncbi:MAG: hypothetical protein Crog4KO_34000 [Crocinitomicaceae bacterium]
MKTLLLSIFGLATFGTFAQNVNIPDANFKAALLADNLINSNSDSEIQLTEANSFNGSVNVGFSSIADLTGIEEFTSATVINCAGNSLDQLDLSSNVALGVLYCNSNQLTTLNLSSNTALTQVNCSNNQLLELDMANGNNINVNNFIATNNPSLSCIQVDDSVYSTANWTNIDATAFFSINCGQCTVTIPDANFKAYLVGNASINTNGDTEIQCTEASAFSQTLDCSGLSISDLTGIEAFTNLDRLWCYNNNLTSIDVSNIATLTNFQAHENQLTSIDLSNNPNIIYAVCYDNQLTSLDVSNLTQMISLRCGDNNLTSLDLSDNAALDYLQCYNNNLTNVDLSNNPALEYLHAGGNNLSSINLTQNTLLENAILFNNSLTTIDLSQNTNLTDLDCRENQLTSLDLSSNTALTYLQCSVNPLVTLDFSQNTALVELICQATNQLTSVDLSQNTALEELFCNSSAIANLDLSNCIALTKLYCNDGQLSSLDVKNGNNISLTTFNAMNNPNLTCIQVDDAAWSTSNWTNIDVSASFSENCCNIDNSISNVGLGSIELQAGELGATYQWVDCDNSNQAISGETTQSFEPTSNGNYACVIDNGSCSDTTDCFAVTTIGIEETFYSQFSISPNPARSTINIQSEIAIENVSIQNTLGQMVLETTGQTIDISNYPNGVYLITIFTEDGSSTKRFIKE